MSEIIDKRTVEMRFDNTNFEKNVAQTQSTLEKLKDSLQFKGAEKGFGDLEKSSEHVKFDKLSSAVQNISDKFSGLGFAAEIAMYKIVSSVEDSAFRLAKAMSVDNITAGWTKLQQKANSESTLLAQGYDLEVVEKQLEKLNWFYDETSYNFTDMIDNIAKFTATGQDLEGSVTAMQGIALWAAKSGQNAQKASGAMYQLSQALGAGVMRREDYRSIQNASMDTDEFRQKALDAGVALKTLRKNADGTYTSLVKNEGAFSKSQFAEHLTQDMWFTTDVMMEVYKEYARASDQIKEIIDTMDTKYNKGFIAGDLIQAYDALQEGDEAFNKYLKKNEITGEAAEELKKMVAEIDAFGISTFKAGQEYRTFQDVLDATKDAVSTKWMGIFERILGNIEQQKEIWTTIGEKFYEWFAEPLNYIDGILEKWNKAGGRDSLFAGLGNIAKSVGAITTPIKEAFSSVFKAINSKQLVKITKAFENFTAKLIANEKVTNSIRTIFEGFFKVLHMIWSQIKVVVPFVLKLVSAFAPLVKLALSGLAKIMELIGKLAKHIEKSEVLKSTLDDITEGIKKISENIGEFAKTVWNAITHCKVLRTVLSGISTVLKKVGEGFTKFNKYLKESNALSKFFSGLWKGTKLVLSKVWEFIKEIGETLKEIISNIVAQINLENILKVIKTGIGAGLIAGLIKFLRNFSIDFDLFGLKALWENLKDIFEQIGELFDQAKAYINLKFIGDLAKALLKLSIALLIIALIPADKLDGAVKSLAILMAMLGIISYALIKAATTTKEINKNGKNVLSSATSVAKIGSTLVGIGTAMILLAASLKIVSSIDESDMERSLLGLVSMMAALLIFIKLMPTFEGTHYSKTQKSSKFIKNAQPHFVRIGLSLVLMAAALKIVSTIKTWKQMGIALISMAGMLVALGVFMRLLPQNGINFSKSKNTMKGALEVTPSLIKLSLGMVILAAALKIASTMSWKEMGVALISMGGMLVALGIFMRLLPKTTGNLENGYDGVKAGLQMMPDLMDMAVLLIAIAGALKIVSKMSWKQMGVALVGIGSVLALLAGFSLLLSNFNGNQKLGILTLAAFSSSST